MVLCEICEVNDVLEQLSNGRYVCARCLDEYNCYITEQDEEAL